MLYSEGERSTAMKTFNNISDVDEWSMALDAATESRLKHAVLASDYNSELYVFGREMLTVLKTCKCANLGVFAALARYVTSELETVVTPWKGSFALPPKDVCDWADQMNYKLTSDNDKFSFERENS